MRHRELKRLFRQIVLAAAPVPLGTLVSACAGHMQVGGDAGNGGASGGSGVTLGGKAATGGSGTAIHSSTGVGGFLGTVALVGGSAGTGGSSSTSTSPGVGGFLGTVALVGGSASTGGSSTRTTTSGVGGFLGTVALVGGASATGGASGTVTCLDAPMNGTGGASSILNCPAPFCVVADAAALDASTLGLAECTTLCGQRALSCELQTSNGPTLLKCNPDCTGRRPDGLAPMQAVGSDDLGTYFSEVAHLEAASVAAFRALGRQLGVHGAPQSLRQAARRATRDEIRHARMARKLAERFGGRYVPPQVTAKPAPSLETIAVENATEGCVRETFGALVATYQAQCAIDPQVRKAMQCIARDETRHAALAWRIARWAERRLDAPARRRVRLARQSSVESLLRDLQYQASESLRTVAGVPQGSLAQHLAQSLSSELWN
jgi:hypothetical protein